MEQKRIERLQTITNSEASLCFTNIATVRRLDMNTNLLRGTAVAALTAGLLFTSMPVQAFEEDMFIMSEETEPTDPEVREEEVSAVGNDCIVEEYDDADDHVISDALVEETEFELQAAGTEAADSGTCGENLTWTLDSNGLLTISGTGAMDSSGHDSFSFRPDIRAVEINDGVTSIGDSAFEMCTFLRTVDIPESVVEIDDNAFCNCERLESINMPDHITFIGEGAFAYCYNLASIKVPEKVTSILDYTFQECTSLVSIEMPDSLESIGEYAFWRCSSLTEMRVPENVKTIGADAFSECTGLTNIQLSEGVTSIGGGAFTMCKNLTAINIPASVTSIGLCLFYGCDSLSRITVDINNPSYDSRDNCNAIIERNTNKLVQGCAGTVIPDSVMSIGDEALEGCTGLINIDIPEGITDIGAGAFAGCTNLKSIRIPDSVTNLGDSAFSYCESLENIELSKGMETVGYYTFSYCESLLSVTLPANIISIGDGAFYECSGLTSIEIPDGVTSIENDAFACCGLMSITIPKSVQWIGENAFDECDGLTIHGYSGSCAETYAKDNRIPFIRIDAETSPKQEDEITISKKPSIKKPTAAKGKITVKWSHFKHTSKKTKPIWKKIRKVQIQCATDKGFTNIVKTSMVGKSKTKAVIKGLSKKTVYYVRVRYFDGTGYSKWSGAKKIKTK